ncbi:DUF4139 domain-containing protein [Endomicrobium proavitum]|uniref:DUF4139 domain-containing protein n=1 Tax=Endomicrobium proavitum TaxID=1408281 RepID=A0A0G3WIC0_9BACT|nr:DUF4139 domain-containing protein [Endomicrobium proavitum]AKL97630.1 conserved exported protein of unknown function [Endomicrobium proavitum]
MKKRFICALSLLAFAGQTAFADVAITIYNNNRALVKETREVSIKEGVQTLEFDDVAAYVDPTSVLPKFLKDASKIEILEQNYDYDLVSKNKLLSKYIGKTISVIRASDDKRPNISSGTLLSVNGGIVVRSGSKIILEPQGEISLPQLPDGLRLKPTLTWLVSSSIDTENVLDVSYQTSGISWNADYVLAVDDKETFADITGWVTINNQSGTSYDDAKLKLIAGDVNTVSAAPLKSLRYEQKDKVADNEAAFGEKSFYEYHMYELKRKSTIKENEIKQIEFISANKIPVKKTLVFNAADSDNVTVNLEFVNSAANNLGLPLPKGKIRVSKYDADSLEFVGEDLIDHTAKDAAVTVLTGNSFDVKGERIRTNYKSGSSSSEESYKITLKNSKDADVTVNVVEIMQGYSQWKITDNSAKFEKKDSHRIEFLMKVPANSESVVTYTVKYNW